MVKLTLLKFNRKARLWLALLLLAATHPCVALPLTLSFQGHIMVAGNSYDGTGRFKFALLTDLGQAVWSHDGTSVNGAEPSGYVSLSLRRGVYTAPLGDTTFPGMTAIPTSVFDNEALKLRVWFSDGTNGFQLLSPDRTLGSVAFAARAGSADVAQTTKSIPNGLVDENALSAGLSNRLTGLSSQILSSSNSLASRLNATKTALTSQVLTMIGQINGLTAAQNSLATNLEALSANQSGLTLNLAALSANHNALAANVGTISADQNNLTANFGTLSENQNTLGANLNNLAASLDKVAASLNNLSNKVAAPNQSFSAVVSADPADPELLSKGYENFLTIAARGWVNGTSVAAPSARYKHAAVWTGAELLIWGGNFSAVTYSASGARYNPTIDQWQTLIPLDAPTARSGHTAVWTGSEMIIWGGFSTNTYVNSGGRFSTETQRWTPISSSGSPIGREGHIAAWSGNRMLIWGGQGDAGLLDDGALYNPSTGGWSVLALANAPAARGGATAVWAVDRVLIWGGDGENGPLDTGAQLIFDGNGNPTQWTAISTQNAPSPRSGHTAVWTGGRMIVWGGQQNGSFVNTGGVYDPTSNTWTPVSLIDSPSARANRGAVWSGKEMVISGGENGSGALATSAAYDPVQDKWRGLSGVGSPEARSGASAIWSGKELIVFGGRSSGGAAVGSLQRLSLDPSWYFFRKP